MDDPFRDLIAALTRIAEDTGKRPAEIMAAFEEYLELEAEISETLGEE